MNIEMDEGIEREREKSSLIERKSEKEKQGAEGRLSPKGNVATTLCMVHLHRVTGQRACVFRS